MRYELLGVVRKSTPSYTLSMTTGYDALTEKEKETLRLLLSGHDAKSIARHLHLSVHTIHERLRDSRRKLSVSSSREAARLLHRIESQAPELLGDNQIGADAPRLTMHARWQTSQSNGGLHHAGWLVGGIAMIISLALLAALAQPKSDLPAEPNHLTAALQAAINEVAPTASSEAAATDSARRFLAMLDRDDWASSWQATHKAFQLLNTVEWWSKASRSVRDRVGEPVSRELATVDFTSAPPNGYWIITFKARYSKRARVTETLQMASEGADWKLAAITVE